MDLIDLFIGSEGTLGVITTVTFRALSPIPTTAMALVPCRSEEDALALVADLRARARPSRRSSTWTRAASRSFARTARIGATTSAFPEGTALALLVQMELPPGTTEADAFAQIEASLTPRRSRHGDRRASAGCCTRTACSTTPRWRCRATRAGPSS